jgi:uncharacterized protein (DUF4415 family)
MKSKNTTKAKQKAKEVYLDVTEEQYQAMQAEGIDEEALLKPGRHKFVRGLFKQMHPDYDPKQAKVRISIYLDADVLSWFRARAAQPNAAPYQTQINNELRALMERTETANASAVKAAPRGAGKVAAKSKPASATTTTDYSTLLDDPHFIAAVAARVRQQPQPNKRARKAA